MEEKIIGIMGGSGLYEMEGLEKKESVSIDTPFGEPSDDYHIGYWKDVKLIFLPRHGKGHRVLPSEINYRANIYGMKKLGAEWIISASAVGSMKKEIAPGHIVIIDQFFDWTKKRESTFFGKGIVGHVSFANPICSVLSEVLYESSKKLGAYVHKGGTYLCIEGPQFSTRAESNIYRKWGVDVIGMTNATEAKLAREAEICYATLAMVTDYDCWLEGEEEVTIANVLEVLQKNSRLAQEIIKEAITKIEFKRDCICSCALEKAILTDKDLIPEKIKKDLDIIIGSKLK